MSALSVNVEDTIVAIGSSHQPATRGVVRFTGPSCMEVARSLGVAPSRSIAHRIECMFELGDPLGRVPVAALLWPNRRSYTGQPSLEIHTLGSLPILQAIAKRAIHVGARAARPGEFTLRAFLAGRMDLTQAEAVLGVIEAEHRGALDHALGQLAGNLSRPLESHRAELLDLLADVEAGLDFVDEDIQFIDDEVLLARLHAIAESITETRGQLLDRAQDHSEVVIALRGFPNAGKSRLLNQLVGRDAALVADIAGTTRDVVSVAVKLEGRRMRFLDTAGIEAVGGETSVERIAAIAQDHGQRAGDEAGIRLWCVDASDPSATETHVALQSAAKTKRPGVVDVWVATKCDRATVTLPGDWIATSSVSGSGIQTLVDHLIEITNRHDQSEQASVIGTSARCTGSLLAAENALHAAIRYVQGGDGHEYVSAELRIAADALGEVTGIVYTDDILDRVFSRFCIGK